MNKLISVIVTIYNQEQFLKECLDSLLSQTYRNFEVLMIDDGSTDNSVSIAQTYTEKDNRFILIASQHIGFPAVKNLGLTKAKGDYIIFLDADDSAYPEWLEFLYRTVELAGADISTCYYDEYYDKKKAEPPASFYITHQTYFAEYSFLKMNLIYNKLCSSYLWNKLIKKELYQDIVFKDQIALSDISEIYKIFHKAKKVIQIQLPLIHYRRHEQSMGKQTSSKGLDYYIFRVKVIEESAVFVWEHYPQSRHAVQLMLTTELQRIKKQVGDIDFKTYIYKPIFEKMLKSKVPLFLFKD